MTLLNNMPHLVTHQVRSTTRNELLGHDETFPTNVATDVPAWVQTASEAEIDEFEKRGFRVTHKVYYPTDPGLTEANQILFGTKRLEFRAIADRSAGLGILFKIMAEEKSTRA